MGKRKNQLKEDFNYMSDMGKANLTEMTIEEHVSKFMYGLCISLGLIILLTLNFIGLSTALNINKESSTATKYLVGIFALFFGIIYMIVGVYYYRIIVKKQPIEFDKNRLFPF